MVITQHRNIISKRIVKDIDIFVIDILQYEYLKWRDKERQQKATDVIKMLLNELQESKKIERFKVVCDKRNNPKSQFDIGVYNLEIFFVQTQCLNKTHLHYVFGTSVQY